MEEAHALVVLTQKDWTGLAALFQRVFGHELKTSLADYKYADGRGESVALVGKAEQVLAHCGMMYRPLLIAGKQSKGVQYGDLMVAPGVRGEGGRFGSPFYRVFTGALSRLPAAPDRPLVFGYPSERATRLGERLGLIMEIDQVLELSWPTSKEPLRAIAQKTNGTNFAALVDRLWQEMAKDLPDAVVGVRDGNYFDHRYFHHPVNRYHIFLLRSRWLNVPEAAFVLSINGEMAELVDWVAPIGHGPAVIEQARRAAGGMGAVRLLTWQAKAYAKTCAAGAASCQVLPICAAVGGEMSAQWIERFKSHMWVTAGDTDYH